MRNSPMPWLAIAMLAVMLAACGTYREEVVQENLLPTDYKQDILDTLRSRLDDPTGIRDAAITDPMLKPVAGATRYVVCFRYNAREGSRYAGVRENVAVFYSGKITQYLSPTPEQCGGAPYKPFPELERLCRSLNCST